jgi:hypothetical protein
MGGHARSCSNKHTHAETVAMLPPALETLSAGGFALLAGVGHARGVFYSC